MHSEFNENFRKIPEILAFRWASHPKESIFCLHPFEKILHLAHQGYPQSHQAKKQ